MYNVRALKNHEWQGKERKPGDVYEVDERDACVEGARILGLSERVEAADPAPVVATRRGRQRKTEYPTRAMTAEQ